MKYFLVSIYQSESLTSLPKEAILTAETRSDILDKINDLMPLAQSKQGNTIPIRWTRKWDINTARGTARISKYAPLRVLVVHISKDRVLEIQKNDRRDITIRI